MPLKLKWGQSYDIWEAYPIEGAIMVVIRHNDNKHWDSTCLDQWEIVIGVRYWSRDTGKYFHNVESAKQQAEILVAAVCRKMLKELENVS